MNRYIQYMYSYPHKTAYRPLHGIRLEDYLAPCKDMQNSLYFHVPFCEAKCGYCNLFSVTGKKEADCDAYLDAMERQAEQIAHVLPCGMHFSDLTLGGGTPLYLNERQLQRIFSMARHYFGFRKGDGPILVETSPRQTTTEKLQLLKENGTTRISIGVQSFHANELHALQRIHTPADAREALQRIRKVGFSCVNLDLIYGIPDQTEESLHGSLQEALTFAPEELFVYPLYIKKGTRLERAGATTSPHTYLLYRFVRDYLKTRIPALLHAAFCKSNPCQRHCHCPLWLRQYALHWLRWQKLSVKPAHLPSIQRFPFLLQYPPAGVHGNN